MPYRPGDWKYNILWKLVEQESGVPRSGDTLRGLLARYLTAIGGMPVPGDHFLNLLAKVLLIKGGTPLPDDKEWDLLRKWLDAEGGDWALGDSVHDLWRKILTLGESSPPVANGLLAGLTGYWKLDEASGTRFDSHGAHHFTVGANPPTQSAGKNNNGQTFDGVNDQMQYDDTVTQVFNGIGKQSISLWVKVVSVPVFGIDCFFGKIGSAYDGWMLAAATGPEIRYFRGSLDAFDGIHVSSGVVSLDTWYHVVATFDPDTFDQFLYINGVRIDGFNDFGATNNQPNLTCGTDNDPATDFANVVLDEVAYWDNRVLSQTDVNALYQAGAGLFYDSFN